MTIFKYIQFELTNMLNNGFYWIQYNVMFGAFLVDFEIIILKIRQTKGWVGVVGIGKSVHNTNLDVLVCLQLPH